MCGEANQSIVPEISHMRAAIVWAERDEGVHHGGKDANASPFPAK